MRIALVSELHANLEALKVLDRALSALSPERVYHLGDLVGCGAHHEECFRWARERLSAAARKYLSLLPMREPVVRSQLLLVHGAPSDPFPRIFGEEDADGEFDLYPEATTVAVGYSHVPQAVVRNRGGNTVLFRKGGRMVRGESAPGEPRERRGPKGPEG